MADFTRQSWTRPRIVVRGGPVDKEINPSSEWTNDFPGCHCLLVNLPGFEEDDIEVKVRGNNIVVSGRRKVDDEIQEHFEKTFKGPVGGDFDETKTIFDGATLRLRIPKLKKQKEAYLNLVRVFSKKDLYKDTQGKKIPGQKEKSLKATSPASSNGTLGPVIEEANKILEPGSDTDEQEINQIIAAIVSNRSIINQENNKDQESGNSVSSGDTKESPKEEEDTKEPNEQQLKSPKQDEIEKSKEKEKKDGDQEPNSGQEDQSSKTFVLVKIAKNKWILLASIISFTLGLYSLRKYIHHQFNNSVSCSASS